MAETLRLSFLAASPGVTLKMAAKLGAVLQGGETLALIGPLGSGKTTFTKGLCLGLGLSDTRLVSSPTYVLEHVYPTRVPVHHYDVYRLASAAEFVALGFEEHAREGAILVIEWAEKVLALLPESSLVIELSTPAETADRDSRRIVFSGPPDPWRSKLEPIFPKVSAPPER